ncbi:MAG: hypothetical protein M1814_002043 [Vezdaea aestivalis]|nr:MAG: hypothetical protein M1814_002043 [Vezdaea aestivalis]
MLSSAIKPVVKPFIDATSTLLGGKTPMEKLRQAHKEGYVLGLGPVTGVQKRFEVDEMVQELPDTYNLFLLALDRLQSEAYFHDKNGFFKIAGIHGLPKGVWDGVIPAGQSEEQAKENVGYCTHGSPLFPFWHRVYLALLEQSLYVTIMDIVEEFPASAKPKYKAAARLFRLPYWDYYRPRATGAKFPGIKGTGSTTGFDYDFYVPRAITLKKVMIRTPQEDKLELKENPLRFTQFPKGVLTDNDWAALGGEGTLYSKDRTFRHITFDDLGGSTAQMNKATNMRREDNTRYMLSVMTADIYTTIETFCTDAGTSATEMDEISSGSMEALHNDYHVIVGGAGGHMSNVPIAAFDPIFYLHHANIDRYTAIWQNINPKVWYSHQDKDSGLPLEKVEFRPFRTYGDGTNGWYNSDSSRYTESFGYYYADQRKATPIAVKNHLKKQYEWSRRLWGVDYGSPPASMMPRDLTKCQIFQYDEYKGDESVEYFKSQLFDPALEPLTPVDQLKRKPLAETGVFSREWYIDNKVNRLALNGAFTIYWFLSEDDASIDQSDPRLYIINERLVGLSHVFAMPVEICDNCDAQATQALKITNTSPITAVLLDYIEVGELGSLDPEHVVDFLSKRLKWRIVQGNGDVKKSEDVQGFTLGVSCKATPLPRGSADPLYLDYPQIEQAISRRAAAKATK